jgi:hypothetical protein
MQELEALASLKQTGTDDGGASSGNVVVDAVVQLGWPAWILLLLTLLIVAAGSRVLSSWVSSFFVRNQSKRERNAADGERVLLAIQVARAAYLRFGTAKSPKPVDRARDSELAELANAMFVSAAMTGSKKLTDSAKSYSKVGELFAAGDTDTSAEDEDEHFWSLLEIVRSIMHSSR